MGSRSTRLRRLRAGPRADGVCDEFSNGVSIVGELDDLVVLNRMRARSDPRRKTARLPSAARSAAELVGRDGNVVSTVPADWADDFETASVIWDGAEFVVLSIGGPLIGQLTGLDEDARLLWTRSADFEGIVSTTPTAAGFLVAGAGGALLVAPHARGGDPIGPAVHFFDELGIPGSPSPQVVFASHGSDVLAAFVTAEPDGSSSLHVVHVDAMGHPVLPDRELLHASMLPLQHFEVLWAGYSFAVAFGGGDTAVPDRRVFLLRVCP